MGGGGIRNHFKKHRRDCSYMYVLQNKRFQSIQISHMYTEQNILHIWLIYAWEIPYS